MKRIGINIQHDVSSGTGRLQINLLNQLASLVVDKELNVQCFTFGTRFPRPNHLPKCFEYKQSPFPGKIQRVLVKYCKFTVEKLFNLNKVDWIIDFCLDNFSTKARKIAYIPDVAWNYFDSEHYERVFPKKFIDRVNKSIVEADKVLTLSEFSLHEICNYYPVNKTKCAVSYCGIDPTIYHDGRFLNIENPINITRNIPTRYILYVGSLNIRKNPEILSKSMKELGIDYSLVHVGPIPKEGYSYWGLDLPNLFSCGFVSEEELAILYRNANCVVMPSFFEGFGIPIIEGMASGTLIICSDIPIFREITDGNALFFDPHDHNSLVNCIKQLYKNTSEFDDIRENALKRSHLFRWDKFANKIISLLD